MRCLVDTADIPDVTLSVDRSRLETLRQSLDLRLEAWSFIGRWFREAFRNERFLPCPMPILAWLSLETGKVPSLDFCCSLIAASAFKPAAVSARVYSFFTAFLRELHFAIRLMELCPACKVEKNLLADLEEGVDWNCLVGNKTVRVAIAHQGKVSAAAWNGRKAGKLQEGVVVLQASAEGQGVHLISEEDIRGILA